MFSNTIGDPMELSQYKDSLRSAVHKQWPFLTPFDLLGIDTERQLALKVRDRTGRTLVEVAPIVHDWMGRQGHPPAPSLPSRSASSENAWENEGGAPKATR